MKLLITMNKYKNFSKLSTLLLLFLIIQTGLCQTFVHPGMMHKESDFFRMKTKVNQSAQPWKAGWDKLVANSHSSSNYSLQGPRDTIYRGLDGVHSENYAALFNDVAAAYANALRWKVAGTTANADKAIQILNAWGSTLKALGGNSDVDLAAGIYGYEIANAAEIMRSYSGWNTSDFAAFQNMMLKVFYPVNHDFLIRHNGTCDTHYWANWDLCNMASLLAIGVLCDNRTIYNEGVTYYKTGIGNGNINKLVNYLYDGNLGQWQESGRDQGHCTLGPALAGAFCEMAWNQGDDLYGYDNNRLWKGFEYIAKYNLGNAVPYTSYNNCVDVNQIVVSPDSRMADRPVWELIYNHYVIRKGLFSPYIQILAEKMRPEGGGGDYGPNSGGFDQIGYGTLTATLETLSKTAQTITFPALSEMTVGNEDKDPNATATSGSRCYYTTADPTIAEIVNNKIHAIRCGTTTIKAWQVGDELYGSATPVSQTISISDPTTYLEGTYGFYAKSTGMAIDVNGASTVDGASVIQWSGTGGLNQRWILTRISGNQYKIINGNSAKALDVVGNSNTPGALIEQRTYTGEDYQIWEITDNCDGTFKIINKGSGLALGVTGSSTIKGATYEINSYTGGNHQKFTYWYLISTKKTQEITFGALPQLYPGDTDYILTATASSTLPISYFSTNPAVATVTNGVLHVLSGGTTSIIASQSGDVSYNPAFDIAQVLVTKKSQTINFLAFPEIHYKDPAFILNATTTSELPLNFSSLNSTVAAVFSGTLTVGIPGISIISVTQTGNAEYLPVRTEQTINVLKLDQTISYPMLPTLKLGDADYSPAATSSSNLTVNYISSNLKVASIVNKKIHVVGVGSSEISASQSGNTFYNQALEINQTLIVGTTGLTDISSEIKVYSNPENNGLIVQLPLNSASNSHINVYNTLGKLIYHTDKCTLENHIILRNTVNSICLVSISCNGLVYNVKVAI